MNLAIMQPYFAPRNAAGQSVPVFVDLDSVSFGIPRFGRQIMPLVDVGTFDDGGIIPANEFECTARPSVLKSEEDYLMWYCYRGSFDDRDGKDSYRIGHAESTDGLDWIRKDQQQPFDIGGSEFDDRMTCYPCVVEIEGAKSCFTTETGSEKTAFCVLVSSGL